MTYGNLAYKYDYVQDRVPKTQVKSTPREKSGAREKSELRTKSEPRTKNTKSSSKKANSNKISYTQKLVSVIILAMSAVFMITRFVEVNETAAELESVRGDYAFEESVTSQKTYELEQSIDLSKIEQEATTRLGMKRPEKYQQVYIDVKKNDVTETVSGEVEGFGNRIAKTIDSIVNHIIEIFSI